MTTETVTPYVERRGPGGRLILEPLTDLDLDLGRALVEGRARFVRPPALPRRRTTSDTTEDDDEHTDDRAPATAPAPDDGTGPEDAAPPRGRTPLDPSRSHGRHSKRARLRIDPRISPRARWRRWWWGS